MALSKAGLVQRRKVISWLQSKHARIRMPGGTGWWRYLQPTRTIKPQFGFTKMPVVQTPITMWRHKVQVVTRHTRKHTLLVMLVEAPCLLTVPLPPWGEIHTCFVPWLNDSLLPVSTVNKEICNRCAYKLSAMARQSLHITAQGLRSAWIERSTIPGSVQCSVK